MCVFFLYLKNPNSGSELVGENIWQYLETRLDVTTGANGDAPNIYWVEARGVGKHSATPTQDSYA